jgi:polysaccharide biosynthesis protein PelG
MAGIGFELRELLRRDSLWGLVRAYAYAGLISSGPWVLSILGVMGIGVLSVGPVAAVEVRQFLVSVTYLMAGSLILTGALQLTFTRFIADRLFDKEERSVLPNLCGALALSVGAAGVLGSLVFLALPSLAAWGPGGGVMYRMLMVATLAVLSGCWITVVLLSGLKEYRRVMGSFLAGYLVSFGAALALRPFGLPGLLGGFLAGQLLLLFLMLALVVVRYPSDRLVSFDFLDRRRAYLSLSVTGLLYNVGIWIDKLIFWFTPSTSERVLGPLRASIIYDLPIFLAYLSILPGMAVFLVRVETDFAEEYHAFFDAVRGGETLAEIRRRRDRLTLAVRRGVSEIFKIQGITVLVLLLAGPRLLDYVGISRLHLQLFSIDLVGVAMQVLMLAVFNVLFYLDERRAVLSLAALFVALNVVLTVASQQAGPAFYGYGFTLSTTVTSIAGLLLTSRKLDRLEMNTFMRAGAEA